LVDLILVIVIINLQNLSSTKKHISFMLTIMKFLIKISNWNGLFNLWNSLSSQNGLIDNTSPT